MRIFLSWSGEMSREVARALSEWLPLFYQSVIPWMSQTSIEAGARWGVELAQALDVSDMGILCVTKEAQTSPWFIFEAGALSRSPKVGRVVPVLVDLLPGELIDPLSQFQCVTADEPGIRRLLEVVSDLNPVNYRSEVVQSKLFPMLWPILESTLVQFRIQAEKEA